MIEWGGFFLADSLGVTSWQVSLIVHLPVNILLSNYYIPCVVLLGAGESFFIREENPLKGHIAKPRLNLASCCPPSAPSMACTDSLPWAFIYLTCPLYPCSFLPSPVPGEGDESGST